MSAMKPVPTIYINRPIYIPFSVVSIATSGRQKVKTLLMLNTKQSTTYTWMDGGR